MFMQKKKNYAFVTRVYTGFNESIVKKCLLSSLTLYTSFCLAKFLLQLCYFFVYGGVTSVRVILCCFCTQINKRILPVVCIAQKLCEKYRRKLTKL